MIYIKLIHSKYPCYEVVNKGTLYELNMFNNISSLK